MATAISTSDALPLSQDDATRVSEHDQGTLSDASLSGVPEAERLQLENEELRQRLAELERMLEDATGAQQASAEQQSYYEKCLEEKSEVIRELHQRVKEAQAQSTYEEAQAPAAGEAPAGTAGATPREEELIALSEELEEERKQLKEDEATLMQQMSAMELTMSRERAELARQRSELLRLQNEIHMELEMASRESTLRDRLQPLQRRHQELLQRKGAEPVRQPSGPPVAPTAPPAETPPPAPKDSGLFRRLFGK